MKIRVEFFVLFLVILSLLFIILCFGDFNHKTVIVTTQNGIIDLTRYDFDRIKKVLIRGNIQFYPDNILSPFYFSQGSDVFKPMYVDPLNPADTIQRVSQYGTYRIIIKVKQNARTYGLRLPVINSAYRLWAGKTHVILNGYVGPTKSSTGPRFFPRLVFVEPDRDSIKLTFETANFYNRYSGFTGVLEFGAAETMQSDKSQAEITDGILFGALLLTGLIHLGLFLLRQKDKSIITFSVICFLTAVRIVLTREHIGLILFPSLHHEVYRKIEYITLYAILPCIYHIITIQFFHRIHRTIMYATNILISSLIILVIMLPLRYYGYTIIIFHILLFISLLYFMGILSRILVKNSTEYNTNAAVLILIGLLFFIGTLVIELIKNGLLMINGLYTTVGLILFVITFAYLYIMQFAEAFIRSEKLSRKLKGYSTRLERIVQKRTRQLRRANSIKTRFFINIAHETRTPLTLIENYFVKYINHVGSSPELDIIKTNLTKLKNDMINFLDNEKLTMGRIIYDHRVGVDISRLINDKIVLYRELIAHKNITLSVSCEKNCHTIIDPIAFDRIINNLLDNAYKYTNRSGSIILDLKMVGNEIQLCITNSGAGIPENQLQHIFKPYHQMSHIKQNTQGIGIGLAIVKKIMEEINGTIQVKSEPGNRTEFLLTFTRSDTDIPIVPTKTYTPVFETARDPYAVLRLEEYLEGRDTIFVVEDNRQMLAYMQECLLEEYNVYYAMNGNDALMKLSQIPLPDLIISDVMMDEMDGFTFVEELSLQKEYACIPVIFITAKSKPHERLKGLKLGAVDYVCKPFLMDELKAKITAILTHARRRRDALVTDMEERLGEFLRKPGGMGKKSEHTTPDHRGKKYLQETFGLTLREAEVAELLVKGLEYKEISDRLQVKMGTLKKRIHVVYKKCKVQNKVELVNVVTSS